VRYIINTRFESILFDLTNGELKFIRHPPLLEKVPHIQPRLDLAEFLKDLITGNALPDWARCWDAKPVDLVELLRSVVVSW